MSDDKLSRKEIREPDPFQKATAEFWNKIMEKQKAIAVGLGVVLVLFVAVAVGTSLSQRSSRESGGALARAMELTHRAVEGTMDALQDPTGEKFKTFKEKNEAVAKAMDEVRTQHAGSEAAKTATLFWADAQFQQGKLEEAAKGYEQYLSLSSAGDPLRLIAFEGLGYANEAKKDLDKARDAFDRMSKEAAGEPAKARAAFHLARLLEAQGKKAEAAQAFQKLKDEFKEAPAAREADERLALLAAQGVPMPPKAEPKPAEAAAPQK